ncbi:hypothetical protein HAX54_025297 [Datura stramonium]|uniref:Uncharacterized protein n=1 Tax=Datura stramonium TaxID=4076 RepID=A0ABS8UZX7_DATST|nr:hypothetical protein [Datura stramonium]
MSWSKRRRHTKWFLRGDPIRHFVNGNPDTNLSNRVSFSILTFTTVSSRGKDDRGVRKIKFSSSLSVVSTIVIAGARTEEKGRMGETSDAVDTPKSYKEGCEEETGVFEKGFSKGVEEEDGKTMQVSIEMSGTGVSMSLEGEEG